MAFLPRSVTGLEPASLVIEMGAYQSKAASLRTQILL